MSYQQYRQIDIGTASPTSIVVKLYEGAIHSCTAATEHHQAGRVRERGECISRALAIVGELRGALDHDRGAEIARNLDGLYAFVSDRLLEAHVAQRAEALDEARSILGQLHGAWAEIARSGVAAP